MASNLLRGFRNVGGSHLIYMSIVGVDTIPLSYYRTKLAVESLLADSHLGWTVQRATQFHQLLRRGFDTLCHLPVVPIPTKTDIQPIDASDVAERLVDLAEREPVGRVDDIGGPRVERVADLARTYLRATGRRRPIASVTLPGKVASAFRRGDHLATANAVGDLNFEEYMVGWIAEQAAHTERP